jgi:GDP/UDP-N,N'-diacetylbacillosamine 2-epimerase (hydrolysing)
MPNADTGGRELMTSIEAYVARRENAHAFTSLGQRRYLSLLAEADAVVGNSSSGLLEAPSFKVGTVNIGRRQDGRLKAESVIDCDPTLDAIVTALKQLRTPAFATRLANTVNPYGQGGAGRAIVDILRRVRLEDLVRKGFFDLSAEGRA